MKAIKHRLPGSRDEWLRQRMSGIGGSDAGAVMGVNPYKSAYTLWAEKTGQIDGDTEESEAMRIGRDLEGYVAKRFCKAIGKDVHRVGFSFQSAEHPFMLANIDRKVTGENAGLECKTGGTFYESDYKEGTIPQHYYCQCLHYMAVCGFDRMYLAALVLPRGLYTFCINRTDPGVEDDIKALIKAEEDFWNLVQTQTPPEADGSESTAKTLDEQASDSDKTIDFDDDLLAHYIEIKKTVKEISAIEADLKAKVKAALLSSNATKGISENYTVTWRKKETRRIDEKRLKEEREDIADEFMKVTVSHPVEVRRRTKK